MVLFIKMVFKAILHVLWSINCTFLTTLFLWDPYSNTSSTAPRTLLHGIDNCRLRQAPLLPLHCLTPDRTHSSPLFLDLHFRKVVKPDSGQPMTQESVTQKEYCQDIENKNNLILSYITGHVKKDRVQSLPSSARTSSVKLVPNAFSLSSGAAGRKAKWKCEVMLHSLEDTF